MPLGGVSHTFPPRATARSAVRCDLARGAASEQEVVRSEVRFALIEQQDIGCAERDVHIRADLIDQKGEARPVDIAGRLGVTQPTVTKALSRLQREGLVVREPYRAAFLTDAGRALAEECRQRHRVVVAFLITLGVDEATAEQDAEGIEHHVSDATLAAFSRFIDERGD